MIFSRLEERGEADLLCEGEIPPRTLRTDTRTDPSRGSLYVYASTCTVCSLRPRPLPVLMRAARSVTSEELQRS